MEAPIVEESSVQFVGRASLDGVKTLVPSAKLLVGSNSVQLRAFFGTYNFRSEHIRSIEAVSSDQIYIRHVIQNYPTLVSFSSPGISKQISELSFLPTAGERDVMKVPVEDGPCNADMVVFYFIFWFVTVFYLLSQQMIWLALTANFACGFTPLVALVASKRWRLLLLNPGGYFIDVALPVLCVLVGTVIVSSLAIAQPMLCAKHESLCKPEWSWGMVTRFRPMYR